MRHDEASRPTYLTTIVGVPPMEDFYLGMASERIFLPLIQKTVPEIVDMHFPAEGIFHNLVILSIDKRYPGHARKIMNAVWGLGQLMFSKTVIVVDKDVNVHDLREVAWIVGTHIDPVRDVQMTKGPVDDLDDASELPAYGGKMGIDATRKWASEGYTRNWPARIRMTMRRSRAAESGPRPRRWPSLVGHRCRDLCGAFARRPCACEALGAVLTHAAVTDVRCGRSGPTHVQHAPSEASDGRSGLRVGAGDRAASTRRVGARHRCRTLALPTRCRRGIASIDPRARADLSRSSRRCARTSHSDVVTAADRGRR